MCSHVILTDIILYTVTLLKKYESMSKGAKTLDKTDQPNILDKLIHLHSLMQVGQRTACFVLGQLHN